MKKVAIIGGGITGLSAGWELKKKQNPFILYEATEFLWRSHSNPS